MPLDIHQRRTKWLEEDKLSRLCFILNMLEEEEEMESARLEIA